MVEEQPVGEGGEPQVQFRLTKELIQPALAQVDRTQNRKNAAYVLLELANKGYSSLEGDLALFKELRYVNLEGNELESLETLNELTSLTMVNARKNKIHKFDAFGMDLAGLVVLQIDNNHLVSFEDFNMPSLRALSASGNKISNFDQLEMPTTPALEHVNLAGNQFASLVGIDRLPNLKELSVANNQITSFEGIQGCPLLVSLDIKGNQLSGFAELNKLVRLKNLKRLTTTGNASIYEQHPSPEALLLEVTLVLPQLEVFDGQSITTDVRIAADSLRKAREAALLAEQAAANAEADAAAAKVKANMKLDLSGIAPGGVDANNMNANDLETAMSTNITPDDIEE